MWLEGTALIMSADEIRKIPWENGEMVNIWLIYGWYMVDIWLIYGWYMASWRTLRFFDVFCKFFASLPLGDGSLGHGRSSPAPGQGTAPGDPNVWLWSVLEVIHAIPMHSPGVPNLDQFSLTRLTILATLSADAQWSWGLWDCSLSQPNPRASQGSSCKFQV